MYGRFGKRMIDMAVSAGSLVVLSPLMFLTAGAIKLDSKGPVIFKRRLGLHGREFESKCLQLRVPFAIEKVPSLG